MGRQHKSDFRLLWEGSMKIAIIPYNLDEKFIYMAPLKFISKNIWINNFISINKLNNQKDKDEFIIVSVWQIWAKDFFEKKIQNLLRRYHNNKKVLLMMEPPVVAPFMYSKALHKNFDLILTRNNNLLKNNKYKWLPTHFVMRNPKIKIKQFQDKKFLTLINWNKYSFIRNELYSWREKAIRYYEKNNKEFDLYGIWRDKPNFKQKIFWYRPYPSYKWVIDDKIEALSNYKFNICFENMHNIDWYVTEKIRDSLQARSVPVYRWANNVTDYIPEKCFIDFRKFNKNFDKLTKYLESMGEDEYNEYIYEINKFMGDESKFRERFDEWWAKNFLDTLCKYFN